MKLFHIVKADRLERIFSNDMGPKLRERIAQFIFRMKKNRLERCLLHSMMILKNMAIVFEENPLSTDYILEELARNGGDLKPVYLEMLSLYRNGSDRQAFALLYERVPLRPAKSFALILSRLDRINPSQLADHVDSLLKSLAEKRTTDGMRRTERRSFVVTAFSAVSVFAVMLDFTVVTVFMNAMDMIESIF